MSTKAICESNGIQISMSRKGTPIDDSPIESWHALLKKETLYNNNITSLQEYIQLVEEWIIFYNTTRLKSKIKKKEKNLHKKRKITFLFLIYCFFMMSPKLGSHQKSNEGLSSITKLFCISCFVCFVLCFK